MKLEKIIIKNFKSIENIEFYIKKYGNSYTTMLLGINESGKSNILEAMSFFNTPQEKFNFNIIRNQRNEKDDRVDLWFYLSFEDKSIYLDEIRSKIKNGNILDFEISNIKKNIFLPIDDDCFTSSFGYKLTNLTENLFIKEVQENNEVNYEVVQENDEEKTYSKLTAKLFEEYFQNQIIEIFKKNEPQVLLWKPLDEYLISEVSLNEFSNDISSNIPLRNIFALSGYITEKEIKEKINEVTNSSRRKKIMKKLSRDTTKYIKRIWNHKISIDIEIQENSKCSIHVKDDGEDNDDSYHFMNVRSQGFKQFISLILSLSVERLKLNKKNQLILIDEPETHLHPSGIRDLREELLKIGQNNYLFVSTHSPFLVDRKNKERNIIIKKNHLSLTQKQIIDNETNIIDDEVLREAFGIEVYKDLLSPHRILVEGSSDKIILQKAFKAKNKDNYGITNGHGSNLETLASKLNYDNINILVILDDDKEGKKLKSKIIDIGGCYTENNVSTIRDIVGNIKDRGTIEDVLGNFFVQAKFEECYNLQGTGFKLSEDHPFLEQIKNFLSKEDKYKQESLDNLKKKISDDIKLTKNNLKEKFPLLDDLVNGIIKKLI